MLNSNEFIFVTICRDCPLNKKPKVYTKKYFFAPNCGPFPGWGRVPHGRIRCHATYMVFISKCLFQVIYTLITAWNFNPIISANLVFKCGNGTTLIVRVSVNYWQFPMKNTHSDKFYPNISLNSVAFIFSMIWYHRWLKYTLKNQKSACQKYSLLIRVCLKLVFRQIFNCKKIIQIGQI